MPDPLDYALAGGLGAAGLAFAGKGYSDVGKVGEKAYSKFAGEGGLADVLSDRLQFQPYTVTTATGSNFGMSQAPSTGSVGRVNPALGLFSDAYNTANVSPEVKAAYAAGANSQASANELAAFNLGVPDINNDGRLSNEEFSSWSGYDAWDQANGGTGTLLDGGPGGMPGSRFTGQYDANGNPVYVQTGGASTTGGTGGAGTGGGDPAPASFNSPNSWGDFASNNSYIEDIWTANGTWLVKDAQGNKFRVGSEAEAQALGATKTEMPTAAAGGGGTAQAAAGGGGSPFDHNFSGVGGDPYVPGAMDYKLNLSPDEQAFYEARLKGSKGMFEAAEKDTATREQEVYDRMIAAMAPERDRERLALEQRLAGQGRLGVRTSMFGGTSEQLAQAQAEEEARNQAILNSMAFAGQEQSRQAQLGAGMLSAGYIPQAQLLGALQPGMTAAEQQRQSVSQATNAYGETYAAGLEALLQSALGQAGIAGGFGTSMATAAIGGLFGK